jgi:hypothetical protein
MRKNCLFVFLPCFGVINIFPEGLSLVNVVMILSTFFPMQNDKFLANQFVALTTFIS